MKVRGSKILVGSLVCLMGLNICTARGFATAQAAITLKWIGGKDNSLMTSENWQGWKDGALSSQYGVILDLTSAPSGTELVSASTKSSQLKLMGVTLAANQTLTLSGGAGFRMLTGCIFKLPEGAVLNLAMKMPNPWDDNGATVYVKGSGRLRITEATQFTPYLQTFDVGDSATFEWASTCAEWKGMELSLVKLSSASAKFELTEDFRVGGIQCADNIEPEIRLNGHQLRILSGEQCYSSKFPKVVGNQGVLTFSGGASNDFHVGTVSGVKSINLYNAQIEAASGVFADSPNVNVYAAGVMSFAGSQTLGTLGGTGLSGGLRIADGQTLTVTGGGSYPAMVMGEGSLAVDGESLRLTGRNTYAGSTKVKSGSLTVDSTDGAEASHTRLHLAFDDSSRILGDSTPAPSEVKLTDAKKLPTSKSDGVFGSAAHFDSTDKTAYYFESSSKAMKAFLKGKPFTFSFWIRNPELKSQYGMRYLLINTTWSSYKFLCMYLNKNGNLGFCTGNEWNNMANGKASALNFLTDLPSGYLDNGQWHHVAYVYADKTMSIHVDGTYKTSKTFDQELNISEDRLYLFGKNGDSYYYIANGDYDEVEISDYAWTDAEVAAAADYARFPAADATSDLPKPLAHWDFNDKDNLGKDCVGGHDLKNVADGNGFTSFSDARTYGSALAFGKGKAFTIKGGYPSDFPQGSASFTISLRVRINDGGENSRFFGMGSTEANSFFEVGLYTCPRQLATYFGGKRDTPAGYLLWNERCSCVSDTKPTMGNWVHLTFAYDAENQTLSSYRDGSLIATDNTSLTLGDQDFRIGGGVSGDKSSSIGDLDDLQLFDTVLTGAQVKVLTRSLETGRADPVLSPESPIEVSAGATLVVKGQTHVFKSLSGTGTVSVGEDSAFRLTSDDGFMGTIDGLGLVRLDPGVMLKDATIKARVQIGDGSEMKLADAPFAESEAEVVLPKNLTITIDSFVPGVYAIARSAKAVRLPRNLSGWTVAGVEPSRYRFNVTDKEVCLKLKDGLVIFLK